MKTPIEQQIDLVLQYLADRGSAVPSYFGLKHVHENHEPSCLVFVPTTGDHERANAVGKKEVAPLEAAEPLYSSFLAVDVHIFGECYDVAWALWQNVLNAVKETLQANGRPGRYSMEQTEPGSAAVNQNGSHIVQTFNVGVTMWKGIIPLPIDCDVQSFAPTKQMQTMLSYSKTGAYVDKIDEP